MSKQKMIDLKMDALQMHECPWDARIPITIQDEKNNQKKINHIAFDGCYYYFTVQNACEIIKTDANFCPIYTFPTCREYDNICYDHEEHCFWVSAKKQCNMLYKLDCQFCEIDCICICAEGLSTGMITGISYNCGNHSLVVGFAHCLVEVDKATENAVLRYRQGCGLCITGLLSLCPLYIVTAANNCRQYIYVLDEDGKILDSSLINGKISMKNILFNPCDKNCPQKLEFFLFKKQCYPYLYTWRLPQNENGFTLCPCNYKLCANSCGKCPCPRDSCADVLESIALVEAALAHILNAEGEKLQKVLATTDDLDIILCVNKEINQTIRDVTHLEYTLYSKLAALCECCGCENLCDTGENGNTCDGQCCCAGENPCNCTEQEEGICG